MLSYISYLAFRFFTLIIGLLPIGLLYKFSSFLSFLLRKVFKYRLHVISKNVSYAFPEKSKKEQLAIIEKAYTNLADIMLESFKGFTTSPATLEQQYEMVKPQFIDEWYKEKKNVVLLAGHLGNWEWATYVFPLSYPYRIIGIVKSIKNKYVDRYANEKRMSTGSMVIRLEESRRKLVDSDLMPYVVVYVADQNPTDTKNGIEVTFFGKKTLCLHGAEKFAKRNNTPVIYLSNERTARGHYRLVPTIISEDPSKEDKDYITQKFMSLLEQDIRKQPELWLWSHKRWKREIDYNS